MPGRGPAARLGLEAAVEHRDDGPQMRVLLLGADGQLGFELRAPLGCFAEVAAATHADLDIADARALGTLVGRVRPDVVVNAAAYNDVDGAEDAPARAARVNEHAVGELGRLARANGFGLVHLSTDYVFDGRAVRPYREEDAPCPLGVYGRSKLAGEHALGAIEAPAVVLRTAWLYSLRRPSFVSTILRLGAARSELRVVDDQLGSPTFCRDLAAVLALWLRQLGPQPADAIDALRGVYHLAGDGVASRHELATAAVALHPRREALAVRRIVPIASADFRQRAPRPRYGALDCGLFAARFGLRLPPWREALARALVDAAER